MAPSISQSDISQINVNGPQRISIEDVVLEKGMMEEVAIEPAIVKVETRFSEKEVTIRQVAPMVIVLTGATFLVVGTKFMNIFGRKSNVFPDDCCSSSHHYFA